MMAAKPFTHTLPHSVLLPTKDSLIKICQHLLRSFVQPHFMCVLYERRGKQSCDGLRPNGAPTHFLMSPLSLRTKPRKNEFLRARLISPLSGRVFDQNFEFCSCRMPRRYTRLFVNGTRNCVRKIRLREGIFDATTRCKMLRCISRLSTRFDHR